MSEPGTDQYIAAAVDESLNYTRARVREMRQQVQRMKESAERIARECESFLNGQPYDEEPF